MKQLVTPLVFLLLIGCTNYTTIRQHKHFTLLIQNQKTITFVPLVANSLRADAKNFSTTVLQGVSERDPIILVELENAVTQVLQKKNLNVITNKNFMGNEHLQNAFFEMRQSLYTPQFMDSKKAVTVTPKILTEALTQTFHPIETELVLLAVYQELGAAKRNIVAGFMAYSMYAITALQQPGGMYRLQPFQSSFNYLDLALVNKITGDVLWTNRVLSEKAPAKLSIPKIVEQSLNEFPFKSD